MLNIEHLLLFMGKYTMSALTMTVAAKDHTGHAQIPSSNTLFRTSVICTAAGSPSSSLPVSWYIQQEFLPWIFNPFHNQGSVANPDRFGLFTTTGLKWKKLLYFCPAVSFYVSLSTKYDVCVSYSFKNHAFSMILFSSELSENRFQNV